MEIIYKISHIFLLTKDSFPLAHFFWCYKTLENVENYLYTRFSIEINEVNNMWILISKIYLQAKHVKYMYIACEDLLRCKNNTYNLTCDYYLLHI